MARLFGRGRYATGTYEPTPRPGAGGGPPSGTAGGDLDGTYPNPDVVAVHTSDDVRLPVGVIETQSLLGRNASGQIATGWIFGAFTVPIPASVGPAAARQVVALNLVGTIFEDLVFNGSVIYLLNSGTDTFGGDGDPVATDVHATGFNTMNVGFKNFGSVDTTAANLTVWLALDLLAA